MLSDLKREFLASPYPLWKGVTYCTIDVLHWWLFCFSLSPLSGQLNIQDLFIPRLCFVAPVKYLYLVGRQWCTMNIFVLFLHSFSYILNNAKLTVWISYYERKHGKEEKIPKLPHPNLQITFESRKNGETTRIWFVISFSKVNSPTIHLLFRRQWKFSKLVYFSLGWPVLGWHGKDLDQMPISFCGEISYFWLWTKSWTKNRFHVLINLAIYGKGFALRLTRAS